MKKNFAWILVALLVFVAWLVFRKPEQQKPHQNTLSTSNSTPPAVTSIAASSQNSVLTSDPEAPADIVSKYRQGSIDKEEAIRETLARQNEKSQNYYGRIVDQDRQPISDVEVTGNIVMRGGLGDGAANQTYKTRSDSNGLFEFTGKKGWQLNVIVKKDGYLMGARGEGYQGTTGEKTTPSNRALLVMWKLRGAEPLVGSTIDAKILHDGNATTFNSATGKEAIDGDFRVTLSRWPLEVKRGKGGFNWAVKIEILHGGLIEENDAYPYWAPESGYQQAFEFAVSSNSVPWPYNLERKFYIKNSLGQYGIMQFGIYPELTPARLQVNFTINPSGSRNLEPK